MCPYIQTDGHASFLCLDSPSAKQFLESVGLLSLLKEENGFPILIENDCSKIKCLVIDRREGQKVPGAIMNRQGWRLLLSRLS